MAVCEDNTWFELFSAADGVTYSGYDASLITVTSEDFVAKAGAGTGSTTIKVECGLFSFNVQTTVI